MADEPLTSHVNEECTSVIHEDNYIQVPVCLHVYFSHKNKC